MENEDEDEVRAVAAGLEGDEVQPQPECGDTAAATAERTNNRDAEDQKSSPTQNAVIEKVDSAAAALLASMTAENIARFSPHCALAAQG